MQQQQYLTSTTPLQTPLGSPHFAHHDPWAHAVICCDQDHGASSSHSLNQNQFTSNQQYFPQNPRALDPSTSNQFLDRSRSQQPQQTVGTGKCNECSAECPLEAYCCGGDYCCDGSHGCDHFSEECCADPKCDETDFDQACHEEHPFHPQGHCGDQDMKNLEEWADSKEGCHAIQQLLECCNQPDCDIPVCPTDNASIHPPPVDPLAAIFGSMAAQPVIATPMTDTTPTSTVEAMSHTCHWGNCHLIFKSMPDLLAHVAADHLSAWGSGPMPGSKLTETTHQATVPPPQQSSAVPTPTFMSTPTFQTQTMPSNNNTVSNDANLNFNSAFTTPQQNETDQLLSCLWDDCFPMTDLPSSISQTFPQNDNSHMHTHHIPHNHQPHEHMNANGEPFSPNTMLRHVLEEHLGVPGEIIGWPAETQPDIQQGGGQEKFHHHHHVDPHHLAHHHDHHHDHAVTGLGGNSSNGGGGHHHHHSHPFPTPPSTVNTHASTSPPPAINFAGIGNGKGLICLWPGCPLSHDHIFPDSASLMDHLSEVHIPKGKDSYTCHWDGCGEGQGRIFKSRQKVLRHLQSHTGHKPFVCGVCDQAFSEAAPLSAHMRRHAQQKPFKCEHPGCGKTFAVSSSLTIHMRTHNGEKPYICPHCGRGFVEASNLTKHIRTRKFAKLVSYMGTRESSDVEPLFMLTTPSFADTGERPFACAHPGCGKKFSRPDQLKRHMIVHEKASNGLGHARRRSNVISKSSDSSSTSPIREMILAQG
ncbi:uncharacterized protein IL334_000873 [Kwoniella shivajii]|uniref:C2H2-type domain-containing protein n=1 Tax=Kwoniella shivajii TaxID=564305 RepID=A0ABZ1CQL8_9TREE|nr:hypothetical protein IL334_000873 [Kwoniella shivajii]